MTAPTPDYVQSRVAQINAAIAAGDEKVVTGLIRQIEVDGHPQFADVVLGHLLGGGLANAALRGDFR